MDDLSQAMERASAALGMAEAGRLGYARLTLHDCRALLGAIANARALAIEECANACYRYAHEETGGSDTYDAAIDCSARCRALTARPDPAPVDAG